MSEYKSVPAAGLSESQIKHMVSRFLTWRLPDDFNPDAGISFEPNYNEHTAHPAKNEPVGTNLFDATQAEAMVRHMLEGMPTVPSTLTATEELLALPNEWDTAGWPHCAAQLRSILERMPKAAPAGLVDLQVIAGRIRANAERKRWRRLLKIADELEALAQKPVDGWMPIETAPRNGDQFIAWDAVHEEPLFTMHWDGEEFMTDYEPWSGTFRLWQPLPAPPNAARSGGGGE